MDTPQPTWIFTAADRHRDAFALAGGAEVAAALAAKCPGPDQHRPLRPTPLKWGIRCSVTFGGVTATGTHLSSYLGDPDPIARVRLDGTGQVVEVSWRTLGVADE